MRNVTEVMTAGGDGEEPKHSVTLKHPAIGLWTKPVQIDLLLVLLGIQWNLINLDKQLHGSALTQTHQNNGVSCAS